MKTAPQAKSAFYMQHNSFYAVASNLKSFSQKASAMDLRFLRLKLQTLQRNATLKQKMTPQNCA